MDYGMIGKIEKARRYSEDHKRFHFHSFTATVDGENSSHTVKYEGGQWSCDCDFFHTRGRCAHTMSLEFVLEGMIVEGQKA